MNTTQRTKLMEVLSFKEDFGAVERCSNGSIRISVESMSFDICEERFWTLMEMLSESARNLADGLAARKSKTLAAISSSRNS